MKTLKEKLNDLDVIGGIQGSAWKIAQETNRITDYHNGYVQLIAHYECLMQRVLCRAQDEILTADDIISEMKTLLERMQECQESIREKVEANET